MVRSEDIADPFIPIFNQICKTKHELSFQSKTRRKKQKKWVTRVVRAPHFRPSFVVLMTAWVQTMHSLVFAESRKRVCAGGLRIWVNIG